MAEVVIEVYEMKNNLIILNNVNFGILQVESCGRREGCYENRPDLIDGPD
jgi:hypothetical protein